MHPFVSPPITPLAFLPLPTPTLHTFLSPFHHSCRRHPLPRQSPTLMTKNENTPNTKPNSNSPFTAALPSTFPSQSSFVQNSTDNPASIVSFMAIANEFSMAKLYRRLLSCKQEYGGIQTTPHGSILRIIKTENVCDNFPDAFIFPYGCMVVWGTEADCNDFLSLIVDDAIDLGNIPVIDSMRYTYGEHGSLKRDLITLEGGSGNKNLDPTLERLAIACGLAQSIKLAAIEGGMRTTIERTRHMPEELASTGQISVSRREVSKLMGELFLNRYRYHLSGDLLMTPSFFWENEQYLPSYKRIERYLEVRERGEVLNKRVEVVQELYTLLREELNNQNSTALELAITIMIAFEILLTLITLAKQSVRSMFSACALGIAIGALGWVLWRIYRRRRAWRIANRKPT